MPSSRARGAIGALLLAGVLVACGGGGKASSAENEAEWAWLQQAHQSLTERRAELATLQAQAAAGADEAAQQAAQQAAQLEQEVTAQSEEFTARLVAFLNADPIVEGEPPSERQLAAVRMKSGEDIVLAQEWIDRGGDYKRAIEIYRSALELDPDNADLAAALAAAERGRFMTEERFALAQKGMSQDEVRALLGQPNLHNVREYPERGVVAWFYPTSDRGDAAGVWFEVDGESGESSAYQLKFDAIQRDEGEAAGAEETAAAEAPGS